jgi:hypothetical protein
VVDELAEGVDEGRQVAATGRLFGLGGPGVADGAGAGAVAPPGVETPSP